MHTFAKGIFDNIKIKRLHMIHTLWAFIFPHYDTTLKIKV